MKTRSLAYLILTLISTPVFANTQVLSCTDAAKNRFFQKEKSYDGSVVGPVTIFLDLANKTGEIQMSVRWNDIGGARTDDESFKANLLPTKAYAQFEKKDSGVTINKNDDGSYSADRYYSSSAYSLISQVIHLNCEPSSD